MPKGTPKRTLAPGEYRAFVYAAEGRIAVIVSGGFDRRKGGRKFLHCTIETGKFKNRVIWADERMVKAVMPTPTRSASKRRRDSRRKAQIIKAYGPAGRLAQGSDRTERSEASNTAEDAYAARVALEGVTGDGGELGT